MTAQRAAVDGGRTLNDAGSRRAFNHRWTRPIIAIGAAATVLLFGYGDLWRGGETASALLLTIGYMIVVPIAIMVGPRRSRSQG